MKIILVALALTFVVFFGGDIGGGGGGRSVNTAIEVGDTSISVQEVGREFNTQVQQISAQVGQQFDVQSAIRAGLLDQTLSSMVTRALFDQAARDLGIVAPQAMAADVIRDLPQFQNESGRFDRVRFESYLRGTGLSETQFVAQVRQDLLRTQYVGTIRSAVAAPRPLVDALYARAAERRVAEVVTVPIDRDTVVPDPETSTLVEYYAQNKQRFVLPEYRKVTLASLTPDALARSVGVSDEEIESAYEDSIAFYRVPETRAVVQATFASREEAEQARRRIDDGLGFDDAVETVSSLPPVDLGMVAQAEIPLDTLARAAFELAPGTVSQPVESPLGWHLVRVGEVSPGSTTPLAEVREDIRDEIALRRARDRIYEVLDDVDDGLAGGATIEEVARNAGLSVSTVEAVARDGTNPDGERIDNPALRERVLEQAFDMVPGDPTELVETDDGGFVLVALREAIPSREPALSEVRPRVVAAWKAHQRQEAANATANAIADKARAGADLQALAAEHGGRFERTAPFERTGDGANVARAVIGPVFAGRPGDVVQVTTDAGAAVAKLVEIVRADPNAEARDEFARRLGSQISNDVIVELANALQRTYPVEVNRDVLERTFGAQ